MMSSAAFLYKEFKEILRTPKIIILPAVFTFFGILSPLTGRYMNEILAFSLKGQMEIKLPESTYFDSYGQFFKNLTSICIIIVILTFMGTVTDEKTRGSAALILTKCVSRANFILGKFFACTSLFTFAYVLSIAVCLYYTYFLFHIFLIPNLWLSLLMFWIYGIFIISITIFASILGKSTMTAAVLSFLGFVAISFLTFIPYVGKYTPGSLSNLCMEVLTGVKAAEQALYPIIATAVLTIFTIISSIFVFKRQEI